MGRNTCNATPSLFFPTVSSAGSEWAGGGEKKISEMVSANHYQTFSVPNVLNL